VNTKETTVFQNNRQSKGMLFDSHLPRIGFIGAISIVMVVKRQPSVRLNIKHSKLQNAWW